ncbi:hypothetical protein GCM10009069_05110 [Algimonas arctica]|uniref:Polysaccharide export protein n=1 Tax=Algimonas arctica TaxID=1479486 RepID=A0A8J3CP84_9PROT|nr:polysaccharide biosynthesis/export family protein [Algimonas arctica]GHA84972.1 hypothetical protein GCM10009069_05110 [Algimonas arctica]
MVTLRILKKNPLQKAGVLCLAMLVTGCASTPSLSSLQTQAAERGVKDVTFTDALPSVDFGNLVSERVYPKLQVGDGADVKIFGFEDISGRFIVNRDGTIIFPLIGSQQVEGLDALDLQMKLTQAYGDGFVRDPSITVEVDTAPLGRIVVDGAVNRPEVIDLEEPMRLSEAIALAGGLNDDADMDGVFIVRSVNNQRYVKTVDLADLRGLGSEEPLLIPNDFVFVQADKNRQLYQDFLTLIPALNLAAIIATR